MSYESQMLEKLDMPTKSEVEKTLLKILFKHNGVLKEFGTGQEIVDEIAEEFKLTETQRNAYLETIYRKENRIKRSILWHRLLFRAADSLAKEKLVSRPTMTINITNKKEWMLTEDGYDKALKLLNVPASQKYFLPIKSLEVEKIVKKLIENPRPENYNPFDTNKKTVKKTNEFTLRARGFRQAIIEAYNYKCAFCGIKINSPDALCWEVEAAHIVPHSSNGKDDIWNGIALCHLHHWAFDVGWFTIKDDFKIILSEKVNSLPQGYGKICEHGLFQSSNKSSKILLPKNKHNYPHPNALIWHQENRFYH
jgi:hypothetical protein